MRIPLATAALAVAFALATAGPAAADPPQPVPPPHAGEQGPPPHAGEPGPPPHVQPPAESGNGTPPEHAGPPVHSNAPEHAGPPASVTLENRVSNGNPTPSVRYPLCHATGSASNPYVAIEIALPGILRGHSGHADDIIPPVPGYFEGQNWPPVGVEFPSCEVVEPVEPTMAAASPPAAGDPVVEPGGDLSTQALAADDPLAAAAASAVPWLAFTGTQLWGLLAGALAIAILGVGAIVAARRAAARAG